MKKLHIIFILFLSFALVFSASLLFAEKETEKAAPDQVLIFGSSGDVSRLDPGDVTDGESIQRMDNIFDGLVEYKTGSTEIQPALATSWDISSDGKEITFKLRRGVKFHDGTDFNADAVVFSFARQYDPEHPYHQYGEWAYWGYMFYDIDRVEKLDDYTVKIIMKNINASIMTSLRCLAPCRNSCATPRSAPP